MESLAPLALHYCLVSSYGDDVRLLQAMMATDSPVKIRSGLDVSGGGWRVQFWHGRVSHTQQDVGAGVVRGGVVTMQ